MVIRKQRRAHTLNPAYRSFEICLSVSSFLSFYSCIYISMFLRKFKISFFIDGNYIQEITKTALSIFYEMQIFFEVQSKTKHRILEYSLPRYYPPTLFHIKSGQPTFMPGKMHYKVYSVKLLLSSDMSVIFIHVCRCDSSMCLFLSIVFQLHYFSIILLMENCDISSLH